MVISDLIILGIVALFGLAGVFAGFVKLGSKIVSGIAAGILTYLVGGIICAALVSNVEAIGNFASQNPFFNMLVVAGVDAVVYFIFFLIIRIIFKALNRVVEGTKVGKVINRILGLVLGLALGIVIADIFVWVSYALSVANSGIATWFINDAGLTTDGSKFSFYQLFLKINLNLMNKGLGDFPGLR